MVLTDAGRNNQRCEAARRDKSTSHSDASIDESPHSGGPGAADLKSHADNDAGSENRTDSDTQATTVLPDPGVDSIVTPPPLRIGSYRLLGVLGEGSMGVVYRAEQDRPRREVALKVLKAGTASPGALDRFEQETEVLGRLQHSGIAQIFQAGTADTGYGPQPFFAMELIHGLPLIEYARENNLDTRQRLTLLVKICEGIQHAHQKGVIHRDLKPGNIVVDEGGQPKILDFGIAMLAHPDHGDTKNVEKARQVAGTLPYMSPEQLKGNAAEIDTRSDVYALGVIAYQLLAGRLPYDLHRKTIVEATRIVDEQTPSALGVAKRDYRGDVEAIVAKAMAHHREDRYPSASDLGMDFTRFLRHEPVTARTPTRYYQLRKFVRRNRTVVSIAALAFTLLVAALVWTIVALRRAESAEHIRSQTEGLALKVITAIKPTDGSDVDVAVRMLNAVQQATEDMAKSDFSERPGVEAALRRTLGIIYRSLGDYENSLIQLQAARKLSLASSGTHSRETLSTIQELALTERSLGHDDEAKRLTLQALQAQREALGPADPLTLETMSNLAILLQEEGDYDEAEAIIRDALDAAARRDEGAMEIAINLQNTLALILKERGKGGEVESAYRAIIAKYESLLSKDHSIILATKSNLAEYLIRQRRYHDAEQILDEVLQANIRSVGESHPNTLNTMGSLARVIEASGDTERAEALYRKVHEGQRRRLGENHPDTLATLHNLAALLDSKGDLTQAETLYKRVLAGKRSTLGPGHRLYLQTLGGLAHVHKRQRKLEEARKEYEEVLDGYERLGLREYADAVLTRFNLACVLHDLGVASNDLAKLDQAERLYRNIVDTYRQRYGDEDQYTNTMTFSLAKLLADKGDFVGAAGMHKQVLDIRQRLWPDRVEDIARSQFELGEAYLNLGRTDEAEPLLRACIATRIDKFEEHDYRVANAENALGAVLAAKARYEEAQEILLRTLPIIREHYGEDGKRTQTALHRLVDLYRAWDKPAKAAEYESQLKSPP